VRKAEAKHNTMPKALRWAVLKAADGKLTTKQAAALAELEATDLFTATAWRIKEKLRWIRNADSVRAARWRITSFIRHARQCIAGEAVLEPVRKALETFEKHLERILQRWSSTHSNARMEGLNGLFQAARPRALPEGDVGPGIGPQIDEPQRSHLPTTSFQPFLIRLMEKWRLPSESPGR